ncbi:MAG: cation diffusion facilitator family transporter [Acidimicrobiales bacterium]
MHGHDHGHGHSPATATSTTSAAPDRRGQRRALLIALAANAGFLVAEVVGGLAFNSLALLADAAHMASDVVGLAIAVVAQSLMDRPATARHSFGLKRTEVLGAQVNGLLLVAVSMWIIVEAVGRLGSPADVKGGGVIVIASLGLLVNLGSAVLLFRARGSSLNMRGAFLHMASDAAGSVAAIVAGVAVLVWNADRVDPIVSILVSLLVLWSCWGLLRDTTNVLLEGTPRHIDPDLVRAAIEDEATVEAVHHVHLWSVASDEPALSAHVVLAGEVTLHQAQERGDELKGMLARRFGIGHSTLELECHPCDDPLPAHRTVPEGATGEVTGDVRR